MADSQHSVLVGAYARIEAPCADAIRERLARVPGVSWFDLAQPDKVGLWIEATDLEHAHRKLTQEVSCLPGVLGIWPVYLSSDPPETAGCPAPGSASSPAETSTVSDPSSA